MQAAAQEGQGVLKREGRQGDAAGIESILQGAGQVFGENILPPVIVHAEQDMHAGELAERERESGEVCAGLRLGDEGIEVISDEHEGLPLAEQVQELPRGGIALHALLEQRHGGGIWVWGEFGRGCIFVCIRLIL